MNILILCKICGAESHYEVNPERHQMIRCVNCENDLHLNNSNSTPDVPIKPSKFRSFISMHSCTIILLVGFCVPFILAALSDIFYTQEQLHNNNWFGVVDIALWPASIMFIFCGTKSFYSSQSFIYLVTSAIINMILYASICFGIKIGRKSKSAFKILPIIVFYVIGLIAAGVFAIIASLAAIPKF